MNKLQVHAAIVHNIRVYTDFWFCGKYYQRLKACVCVQWVFFTIIISVMKHICSKKSTVSPWRFLITPQSAVNFTTILIRNILSRTYEVKRRQLLLQLWMHKNFFQNFLIKLYSTSWPSICYMIQWCFVCFNLYTLLLTLDSNILTGITKQLYFYSPYKLSQEATAMRYTYDLNP